MLGLIGKKIGMTRIFTEDGISMPTTIVECKKNRIVQIKNLKKDGYNAIQVTSGNKKLHRINKPESGHFLKSKVDPGDILREFRFEHTNSKKFFVGEEIGIEIFSGVKKVDVTGISKGKGFSGTIKRWNFRSQDSTHGNSLSHRAPGSIGQNQTPGKVFKGKKMAGQLGNEKVTVQSLNIIQMDFDNDLLFIKGSVPGYIGQYIIVKVAVKC